MHKLLLLLTGLFVMNSSVLAQDKETMAQAYYMAAEDAYNAADYTRAEQKLNATTEALGKSNAKIEYLMVKTLMEEKKYVAARTSINKYFDYAKTNKGSDKYNEMLKLLGDLDDLAESEKTTTSMTPFLKELHDAMMKDNEYKYFHPTLKNYFGNESTYKDTLRNRKTIMQDYLKKNLKLKDPDIEFLSCTLKPIKTYTSGNVTQCLVSGESEYAIVSKKVARYSMQVVEPIICESTDDGKTWTFFSYSYLPSKDYNTGFVLNREITIPEAQVSLK